MKKRRHIIEIVGNYLVAETLDRMDEDGWWKDIHFYENGEHIIVFSKEIEDNTVSEETLTQAKLDEMAFEDVFGSS